LTGAGNARASGYIGGANAITGGISNLSNLYYQNQLLNMFANRGGGGNALSGLGGLSPND
jgi:hypothetical protein